MDEIVAFQEILTIADAVDAHAQRYRHVDARTTMDYVHVLMAKTVPYGGRPRLLLPRSVWRTIKGLPLRIGVVEPRRV